MKNLKKIREKLGYTQIDLANILGVKQATIAMWETGKSKPTIDKALKLAKLFNVSVEELFDDYNTPLARR